jgi:predicted hydrocarbon binding protein
LTDQHVSMIESDLQSCLSNRFMRFYLRAAEEQLGCYALHMVLQQAGLERYISHPPGANRNIAVRSQEFARFQNGLRDYYGKSARGFMKRMGQRIFQFMVKEASPIQRIDFLWIRSFPISIRPRKCLELVSRELDECSGKVSFHTNEGDFLFVLQDNRIAQGQNASQPICWVIQGMIQEALLWATDEEVDVEEITCQAVEGNACIFKISRG